MQSVALLVFLYAVLFASLKLQYLQKSSILFTFSQYSHFVSNTTDKFPVDFNSLSPCQSRDLCFVSVNSEHDKRKK
jgi:hypothetical protein